MKKLKLFSLALMAMFSVTLGATDKYYILGAQAVASDGALTKASSHGNLTLKYIKYNGSTYATTTDLSFNTTEGINGKFASSASSANISEILTPSKWGTGSGSAFAAGIKFNKNTTYTLSLGTKVVSKISFLIYPAGKVSSITIGETAKTTSSKEWTLHEWTGSYTGDVSMSLSDNNDVYGVLLLETPNYLTGAWKINSDTVTSANILKGSSAPSMPTFSVGAMEGAPESGDYNVVYSLKAESTEGIFTFTDGVPTAISTANEGSATVIATLTTKDASKYLTPVVKTFEYTVTVSAATAPSFTSVTPSAINVVRGTASNIVAVVEGTPTPTIQWYSNTSASNEGGEAIDGATDLTLNLANAAVGTYYYYAVATNASASVASAVQTISVKPQAPTLPDAAIFISSMSVEIAKADGEAEAAVIEYSTDGDSWNEYSTAFELTATTTVQARVAQSGLKSAVVEATYTKFAKADLVSISDNTTWTFNYSSAPTITLTAETTPSIASEEYYTYADIAALNSADVSGFSGSTSIAFRGQYALRGSNGCQNGWLKFNTTVAGSIEVEFSNTGGSNSDRYVKVNSTRGKVEANGTTKRTETFNVSDGDVIITGVNGTSGTEGTGTDAAIRVYSIVFTKSGTVALDNIDADVKAVKRLENGMLVIEKNGVRYNAQGQIVR